MMSKAWHRNHIPLSSQPRDRDSKLRLNLCVPPRSNPRLPKSARSLFYDKAQILFPPRITRMEGQCTGHDNGDEQKQRNCDLDPLSRRAASLISSRIRLGHLHHPQPGVSFQTRGTRLSAVTVGSDCPKGQRHLPGAIR